MPMSMLSNNTLIERKNVDIEAQVHGDVHHPQPVWFAQMYQDGMPFDQTLAYRALEAAVEKRRERALKHCFANCLRMFTCAYRSCIPCITKEE